MQKRTGPVEQAAVNTAIRQIAHYKVFEQDKKRKETFFNHLLYRHLLQVEPRVTNQGIHSVTLVGETFRPEFCIRGGGEYPLFCVECKKLTDVTAKARFKEGLSQSIVYSHEYKCVLLVFYDFTEKANYSQSFSVASSAEKKFIDSLWKQHRIKVVFVVPS